MKVHVHEIGSAEVRSFGGGESGHPFVSIDIREKEGDRSALLFAVNDVLSLDRLIAAATDARASLVEMLSAACVVS